MLTAELLRRNNRLNQDPIAEESADGAAIDKIGGGRNATLKLKRRISREPNTGKILILPDNTGSNEHALSPYSPTNRQSGGGSTQPTPTSKEHQMVVERFSTGGGFNGSGTKANNNAAATGKKNSPGGLYNISPTA